MTVSTDAVNSGNPGDSGNLKWSGYFVHGQNVQIDPDQVKVGDTLLIVEKNNVKPGSRVHRLIAVYSDIKVVSPEMCVIEGEEHTRSVCTQCIRGSWLWDYFFRNVRTLRKFAHGTARAYDYFGCRCDPCISAHRRYLGAPQRYPYR